MSRAIRRQSNSGVGPKAPVQIEVVEKQQASPDEGGWTLRLTEGELRHLRQALTQLTPREREVACAASSGGANEQIADRLCIALPTLRTHLMRINQKLGTTSKSDLIGYVLASLLDGYRRGLIEPETLHSGAPHERRVNHRRDGHLRVFADSSRS